MGVSDKLLTVTVSTVLRHQWPTCLHVTHGNAFPLSVGKHVKKKEQ